ncbi:fungal-specific transcription factor domain-containing protein [Phyllosticta citribraziliensis]|uniref:Fungal-specific transcription factor domain-containing protein n=1 Tax=Phyllosticta citribraziliensis TaxID=989973 RepID=A0ABR1LHR6_9PEZI
MTGEAPAFKTEAGGNGAPSADEEQQRARKRPKIRRTTFACYRCHRRKIKCDGQKPACSNCVQAKQPCHGILDGESKTVIPRSIAQYLRDKISEKERLLQKLGVEYDDGPPIPLLPTPLSSSETRLDSRSPGIAELDTRITLQRYDLASEAFASFGADLGGSIINSKTKFPCGTFLFASSHLPSATPLPVDDQFRDEYLKPKASNALDQIPQDVKERLIALYTDKILPLYPFVERSALWAAFHRVQAGGASTYDIFIVSMMIAVSMMTSKFNDSAKIASVSQRVFYHALLHTDSLFETSLQNVQGILFLSEYSYLMPRAARVWDTIGLGMRMALELGLHRDPEETCGRGLSESEREMRRCIFWTLYIFDRSTCVTSHRRLGVADDSISTKYPSGMEGSFFINNIRFRRIQSELWTVNYLRRGLPLLTEPGSYEAWAQNIESRMKAWEGEVLGKSCNSWGCDWFNIAVAHGIVFLRRPTPRNPHPGPDSLLKCFDAATMVASGYWENAHYGFLKYSWHAVHHGFEAAIAMLFAVRHCKEKLIEKFGVQKILDTMHLFSSLLVLMSKRWSQANASLESYERCKTVVLLEFMSPQVDSPVRNDELDRLILPHQALADQAEHPGKRVLRPEHHSTSNNQQRSLQAETRSATGGLAQSSSSQQALQFSKQQQTSFPLESISIPFDFSFPLPPEFVPGSSATWKDNWVPGGPAMLNQKMEWDEIQPDASGVDGMIWSM